jgi:hypothetical protein
MHYGLPGAAACGTERSTIARTLSDGMVVV